MTTSNDDRITVQRVTSTVAGEYREWTVTVRQSSPADRPASELTRAGAVAVLPTPVRAWLSAWLEGRMVHAGEHIVPRDLLAAALGQPDPCGTRVVSGGGVRSACLLPVRHDGDHQPSAHTAAPLFPIAEPEPAAPYAGRTAPRRTLPPEAPVRLWNREHTDHLDVIGRAVPGGEHAICVRIREDQADDARLWIAERFEADESVFVAWMDREWELGQYLAGGRRPGLLLTLGPIPKPPRVDQVLGRPSTDQLLARLNAGQTLAEAARAKTDVPEGAPYAGPWPHLAKGDRIGVEHADGTITTHEFSGDHEHPVADEPDRAGRWRAVETMGRQFAERFYREPEPAPEAYTMPDGVGLGTVPEYGQPVDTSCPEHGVDCVLPMPGGPNDRLTQAARPGTTDVVRDTRNAVANGLADLYARLEHLHDAVNDEDDQ